MHPGMAKPPRCSSSLLLVGLVVLLYSLPVTSALLANCTANPCQNRGTCIGPDLCSCRFGFAGRQCQTVLSSSSSSSSSSGSTSLSSLVIGIIVAATVGPFLCVVAAVICCCACCYGARNKEPKEACEVSVQPLGDTATNGQRSSDGAPSASVPESPPAYTAQLSPGCTCPGPASLTGLTAQECVHESAAHGTSQATPVNHAALASRCSSSGPHKDIGNLNHSAPANRARQPLPKSDDYVEMQATSDELPTAQATTTEYNYAYNPQRTSAGAPVRKPRSHANNIQKPPVAPEPGVMATHVRHPASKVPAPPLPQAGSPGSRGGVTGIIGLYEVEGDDAMLGHKSHYEVGDETDARTSADVYESIELSDVHAPTYTCLS